MNNLYYLKAQDEEIALSAEELLTMFNRNISKNTELLNYIGRRNLFEIIGKSRNEGVHSRFIAELLSSALSSIKRRLFHIIDGLGFATTKRKD